MKVEPFGLGLIDGDEWMLVGDGGLGRGPPLPFHGGGSGWRGIGIGERDGLQHALGKVLDLGAAGLYAIDLKDARADDGEKLRGSR